jgi:hypothetical protein
VKKLSIFIGVILFGNCIGFTQKYEIWGIWNIGENIGLEMQNSYGKYQLGEKYLIFVENDNGRGSRIFYEGGEYTINAIIDNEKDRGVFKFYLESNQAIMLENKKSIMGILRAKVDMHFIDEDHMWLEIDYTDELFPTDEKFTKADFKGEKYVYWRKKIE